MVEFSKYEAAGNDFIAINRLATVGPPLTPAQLLRMCNRKTGIGADGVIELHGSPAPGCLYSLTYYNSDGNEGSLCGNGSRCSLAFAERSGLVALTSPGQEVTFEACDGVHRGGMLAPGSYYVTIRDVEASGVRVLGDDGDNFFVHNGSPHHVRFVDDVNDVDVVSVGRGLRWELYGQEGANINFVKCQKSDPCDLDLRTYERGVEDETLACGTGATASSMAAYLRHRSQQDSQARAHENSTVTTCTRVHARGGDLIVSFIYVEGVFRDIRLCGPVNHVFDGRIIV